MDYFSKWQYHPFSSKICLPGNCFFFFILSSSHPIHQALSIIPLKYRSHLHTSFHLAQHSHSQSSRLYILPLLFLFNPFSKQLWNIIKKKKRHHSLVKFFNGFLFSFRENLSFSYRHTGPWMIRAMLIHPVRYHFPSLHIPATWTSFTS